jgi:hypothetical protein
VILYIQRLLRIVSYFIKNPPIHKPASGTMFSNYLVFLSDPSVLVFTIITILKRGMQKKAAMHSGPTDYDMNASGQSIVQSSPKH